MVSRVSRLCLKEPGCSKNDRERQMTGFIADNQAALNGTKKRRKGGQLRQSTAQQDLYQASSISYARSPRTSADELAVARKKVEG